MSNESSKDQNVERRDFIKTLATVPVFGFFLVNLWLKLKKDEQKRKNLLIDLVQKKQAPSILKNRSNGKHLNIGIIGYGGRGSHLVRGAGFATKGWTDYAFKANQENSLNKAYPTFMSQDDLNCSLIGVCDLFDVNADLGIDASKNEIGPGGKPKYVAKVVDSTSSYKLKNLKTGNYLVIALEEENKDYIFQSDSDKIGFHDSYLELPKDSVINLKVFKEKVANKITRPRQNSLNSFIIGNEGDENLKIELLEARQNKIESRITKDIKSDSLIYWFKTKNEIDSLKLAISNEFVSDTFNLKIFKKKKDSLVIKPSPTNVIKFYEDFSLVINTQSHSKQTFKIAKEK